MPPAAPDRSYRLLFLLLLAFSCALLLSLPVLPTQDGPMHLYLASIFSSLLSGAPAYRSYFFIRHYLPPYAVVYYLLAGLGRVVYFPLAEKLVGCLIFVLTACGCRFLAQATTGERGESGGGATNSRAGLVSLFALPLLFNWPFFMGFLNYSLSLSLSLWAMAFWCRAGLAEGGLAWRWRAAYLATSAAMTLTHPVPVLLVCGFALLETAWRAICLSRESSSVVPVDRRGIRAHAAADLAVAAAGCLSVLYFAAFADQRLTGPLSAATSRALIFRKLLSLSFLSIFAGPHLATYLQRLGLFALGIGCAVAAVRGFRVRWRERQSSPADALLLFCGLLLLAIFLLPPDLNGQHFFTARLVVVVWLLLLPAAAAGPLPTGRLRGTLVVLAVLASLGTLLLAELRLSPAAHLLAAAGQISPRPDAGAAGLLLTGDHPPETADLSFDPYRWLGAAYFRRTQTIMINAGFMDSPVIPVGAHGERLSAAFTQSVLESTANSGALLRASPAFRREVLPYAGLLVFPDLLPAQDASATPRTRSAEPLRSVLQEIGSAEPQRVWTCMRESVVYLVCRAPGTKPLPGAAGDSIPAVRH